MIRFNVVFVLVLLLGVSGLSANIEYIDWPTVFNTGREYISTGKSEVVNTRIERKNSEESSGKFEMSNITGNIKLWKSRPWYLEIAVNNRELMNAAWVLTDTLGEPLIRGGVAVWNIGGGVSFVIGSNEALEKYNIHYITPALSAVKESVSFAPGGRVFMIHRSSDTLAQVTKNGYIPGSYNPTITTDLNPDSIRAASSGTGFFITSEGHVVTANHVVTGRDKVFISRDGKSFTPGVVVARDEPNDLAIIKIEGNNFKSLALANNSIKLGDSVSTIGYPNISVQGVSQKYTKGNVSSLYGLKDDPNYMQISVPIQPGNSGGPLVNDMGHVVGVISSRLHDMNTYQTTGSIPQNVNYAVRAEPLGRLIKSSGIRTNMGTKRADIESVAETVVIIMAL